jgi:hypothetical protein
MWIRRFRNEQDRKRLYDIVYQSDCWKSQIAARIPAFRDRERAVITRLVATLRSVLQQRSPARGRRAPGGTDATLRDQVTHRQSRPSRARSLASGHRAGP